MYFAFAYTFCESFCDTAASTVLNDCPPRDKRASLIRGLENDDGYHLRFDFYVAGAPLSDECAFDPEGTYIAPQQNYDAFLQA